MQGETVETDSWSFGEKKWFCCCSRRRQDLRGIALAWQLVQANQGGPARKGAAPSQFQHVGPEEDWEAQREGDPLRGRRLSEEEGLREVVLRGNLWSVRWEAK